MIKIYNLALIFLAVLLSPIILVLFVIKPKLRAGFFEKIGFYGKFKKTTDRKTMHFHAVSVGEVNAIENLVKSAREKHPEYEFVLTTTTKTGQEVANAKLKDTVDKITYFPYDFCFSVKSFLNTVKPDKIVIAETEIWPNFAKYAHKKNLELYIVNGRISPKSFDGYKKIKFFISRVLKNYTKILMQTEGDAQRMRELADEPEKIVVMGNLKFDIKQNLTAEEVEQLKSQFCIGEAPLFVAASTHSGEDELVLSVYEKVKKEVGNLKMIIAPRHPQRFAHVEGLLKKSGFSYGKRSEGSNFSNCEIIMLDTMGELSKIYSLAKIAFIGGSFSNTGGHNPLEANIWGVPVISGVTVFNFKDIYKLLTAKNAAKIVADEKEFADMLLKFLGDDEFYSECTNSIKQIFSESSGAVGRVLSEVF